MVQTSSVILVASALLFAASPAIASDAKSSTTTLTTTSTTTTATSTSTGTAKKDSPKDLHQHHHHHPHHHHHHRVHPHHHHHHHHKHLKGSDSAHTEHHDEHTQHNLLSQNHEHLKAPEHEHNVHDLKHVLEKSNKLPVNKKVELKAHPSSSSSVSLPSQTARVEKGVKPKTKLQLAIDDLYKLNGRDEEPEVPSYGGRKSNYHNRVQHYARPHSHHYVRHMPESAYLDPEVHTYTIPRRPHHGAGHMHTRSERSRPQGRIHHTDEHVGHVRPSYHEHEHEHFGYGHAHGYNAHEEYGERFGPRSWDDDLDEIMARSFYDFYDELD